MKTDLRGQVNTMAEALFRAKLKIGDIALRLVSSNDPALNWKIAETLEIDVADIDPLLYRKNGEPLEKACFRRFIRRNSTIWKRIRLGTWMNISAFTGGTVLL